MGFVRIEREAADPNARFGHSTHTLTKPAPEALAFTESFDYALLSSAKRGRLGWFAFLFPDKKLDQATETCRKFIDRFVQEALAEEKTKERPYVFMNEMLDAGASQEYIRDQLLSMILGGRDTGASTLSSLFWVLARRRDVYEKLRRREVEAGWEETDVGGVEGLEVYELRVERE
ncbi:MAG: cytochrome P450 [Paludibaculum sp.]